MVWKHENVAIKAGKAWSDKDGVQHPANWMIWTDPEKIAKGLTFTADEDTSFDDRFYWSKGIERSLSDILVTDEKDEKVIDPITGKQMVQLGLKSIWVTKTKTSANSLMSPSDWLVTRKAETDTAIPSDISTYRTGVRTASKTIEDKINACSDLDAFKALFVVPVDSDGNPTGNAPINDWPDEVS